MYCKNANSIQDYIQDVNSCVKTVELFCQNKDLQPCAENIQKANDLLNKTLKYFAFDKQTDTYCILAVKLYESLFEMYVKQESYESACQIAVDFLLDAYK